MAWVQDDSGYWYDDQTFSGLDTIDQDLNTGYELNTETGDYYDPGTSISDPIIYGPGETYTSEELVNPDSGFADIYNLTPEAGDSASWSEADKQAAIKLLPSLSNANTATSGGPGTTTDYIGALVAAVKSGSITSAALKELSAPVQAAVTKALTAAPAATPSFLDKIGDFLKTPTGQAVGIGGIAALLQAMGNKGTGEIYKGYQGGIPNLSASRTMNPIPTTSVDAAGKTVARRPGQGGITYFTPMQYTPVVSKPVTPAAATPTDTASPATTTETVTKAMGGIAGYAMGGLGSLGGYSDGGRLLRGPGDGVSDSIPAIIGKKQPARLADGEFVVPARVVSEIGNGSTEAGARKLYAMMDRVQKARRKTLKNVAANSRADKYLPA